MNPMNNGNHERETQFSMRDSAAAELALAALLAAAAGHATGSYLVSRGLVPESLLESNRADQRYAFQKMNTLYNKLYNQRLDLMDDRVSSRQQFGPDDIYQEAVYREPLLQLYQKPLSAPGASSSFLAKQTLLGRMHPEIHMNPRRGIATLAHEFGHADLAGRVHRTRVSAQEDPIAWAQEKRFGPDSNPWTLRSLAVHGGRGWRTLLPLAGAGIGGATGLALGPDVGAGVGATAALVAGLPTLAIEVEAWRRGQKYAQAAGLGRRQYYRAAAAPLMTYVGSVGRNVGLGAGAGALTGLLTSPESQS